jgi:hypothetical protein
MRCRNHRIALFFFPIKLNIKINRYFRKNSITGRCVGPVKCREGVTMSTTHDNTTRAAMLAAVIPGITPAALDIFDSSNNLLVSFAPVYTNNGLTATLNAQVSGTGVAAGNAHHARLRNAGNSRYQDYSDLRTSAGGDLQLDNLSIAVGQTCNLVSHTVSAPL